MGDGNLSTHLKSLEMLQKVWALIREQSKLILGLLVAGVSATVFGTQFALTSLLAVAPVLVPSLLLVAVSTPLLLVSHLLAHLRL